MDVRMQDWYKQVLGEDKGEAPNTRTPEEREQTQGLK